MAPAPGSAGGCGRKLSIGLEGGATGTWDYDTARVGGFVRYEWASGEAIRYRAASPATAPAAAGWMCTGPFATFSVLTRF